MTHLLAIKSNTAFPKEVELHNNHIENYGKITKSFKQSIKISKQINANCRNLKTKRGQVN